MTPAAAREHIESNKLTLEDMKQFIPNAKLDRDGKKMLQWKEKDKERNLHASKVRATLYVAHVVQLVVFTPTTW